MTHENFIWPAVAAIVLIGLALGGCSTTDYRHGYTPPEEQHYTERCPEKFDNRRRLWCLEGD